MSRANIRTNIGSNKYNGNDGLSWCLSVCSLQRICVSTCCYLSNGIMSLLFVQGTPTRTLRHRAFRPEISHVYRLYYITNEQYTYLTFAHPPLYQICRFIQPEIFSVNILSTIRLRIDIQVAFCWCCYALYMGVFNGWMDVFFCICSRYAAKYSCIHW